MVQDNQALRIHNPIFSGADFVSNLNLRCQTGRQELYMECRCSCLVSLFGII